MTPGVSATAMASSTRPIGITHTGQPGPVDQLDVRGQHVLDAVAVDGVGVAAAHLHELEVVVAGQLGDAGDQARGRRPGSRYSSTNLTASRSVAGGPPATSNMASTSSS